MTKLFETLLADIAVLFANAGAGMASTWYTYQPEEPEMLAEK